MKYRFLYIIGVMIVFSGFLYAQLAEDALRYSQYGLGVGAQTTALGGTSVGIANDFSALFSNPAGLAQLHDYEFSAGISRNGFTNDVTFWGNKISSDNNVINFDNLSLVYPIPTTRGSLSFALAYGRTAGYNGISEFGGYNIQNSYTEKLVPTNDLWAMTSTQRQDFLNNDMSYQMWLSDTLNGFLYPILTDSLDQRATVLENGGMNHWSFGGAIDIAPNISVGISLNIASGKYTYDREYLETDTRNVYHYAFPWNINQFRYDQTFSDDISGFNALFGLMYRQEGKFRLGLSVRTPTYFDISENFTKTYESLFKDGSNYSYSIPNTVNYRVTTPMILSGGFSVQPMEWLMIGGDAEYIDWTQIEMSADDSGVDAKLQEQTKLAKLTLFRETTNLRGGAEVSLKSLGLKLRGGIAWNPSPYKADENTTKYDQMYYTAGMGILLEGNTWINISYVLGSWLSYRSTSDLFSMIGALQTRENITTQSVNLTVTYLF